jgi:hypothetical protein
LFRTGFRGRTCPQLRPSADVDLKVIDIAIQLKRGVLTLAEFLETARRLLMPISYAEAIDDACTQAISLAVSNHDASRSDVVHSLLLTVPAEERVGALA